MPTSDGVLVEVGALDALWVRRLSVRQNLPDEVEPAYAPHVNSEIWNCVRGLLLDRFRGTWVNHIAATESAENKIPQLVEARAAGLRIPPTLVSQEPVHIREFCSRHPGAIVKPLRQRGGELAGTHVAGAELLSSDAVLSPCPAMYQEQISGNRHLRVTMFGDRCHAARIETDDLDSRMNLNVPYLPHVLDASTRAGCVTPCDGSGWSWACSI